jgi:hypothetical protein
MTCETRMVANASGSPLLQAMQSLNISYVHQINSALQARSTSPAMPKQSPKQEAFLYTWEVPNATYAVKRKFVGRWHICASSEWSYDYLAMEGRPEIGISSSGYGTIRFGAFEGILDAMKDEFRPDDVTQFSFYGSDEDDEVCGRGAMVIENGLMKGRIVFHRGITSDFEAKRLPGNGS